MRVVALAGGTGSAKLLRGLAATAAKLTVVANVGDNYWYHGLYVCPDIDISMYTLAGVSDYRRGWGVEGDSFNALSQLSRLGEETWFKLGDMDLATSLVRTELLLGGCSLTEATQKLLKPMGVRHPILPATDSDVETWMVTKSGRMHLQEYWVKRRGRPRVQRVEYKGAGRARPSRLVREAISKAEIVLVCPANPITSIGPILAIDGMRRLLSDSRARVVALSPMAGTRPFSGPAGRLMRQLSIRPDSVGVASLYRDFIDELVIDSRDARLRSEVEKTGVGCTVTNTFMRTKSEERRLASALLRH